LTKRGVYECLLTFPLERELVDETEGKMSERERMKKKKLSGIVGGYVTVIGWASSMDKHLSA